MLRSKNILLALIQSSLLREKGKELEIALVQLQARSHKEENRLKASQGKKQGRVPGLKCVLPAISPSLVKCISTSLSMHL